MTIAWDEDKPADSNAYSQFPGELRSFKTALRTGLEQHFYWQDGASIASAGQMKPGAARAFYATESALSNYTNGFLLVASDTSRLYGLVSSATTAFVGSARAIEHTTLPQQTARWLIQGGTGHSGGGLSSTTAFPTAYAVAPSVMCSLLTGAQSTVTLAILSISALTSGGFTVDSYRVDTGSLLTGGESGVSFHWISMGTMAF